MGLTLLAERHAEQIAGVLSCVDRVIVQGTLPVFCYADGRTAYLSKRRIRRRLRTHGLIKKASHCYKYYLTALGKQVVALGLKLKELVIIPDLAAAPRR